MAGCWGVRVVGVAAAVWAAVAVTAAAPADAQPGGFGDVAEDTYYSVPVATLAELGVFAGTECAQGFCPDDPIDRKTMAVWVVRVLDGADPPAVSESRFDDVDMGSFFAPFIERLAELGVTGGCGDGSGFCPDQTVSRAQMAVFLRRAYGLPAGADPGFSDVPGDAWYADAVSSLAASAITGGCGDGTNFCPAQDTNRAQMATFIHRAENRAVQPSNGPPDSLGLHRFYEKYVDADGLPIVASASVPDAALYRARDIVTEMLSGRPRLRAAMERQGVRVAIMARSTVASDLPEFSDSDTFWDNRTKGGGFFGYPVVVIAEENLLCYHDDVFPNEDITVHEFAHAIHAVVVQQAGSSFDSLLNTAYTQALDAGLWANTYAGTNAWEYFAEGVQSWFDVNDPPGFIHNEIDTRAELEAYDPALAGLIQEVLGDATVTSSCHDALSNPQDTSRIQGIVLGPDRAPVEGIGLWAWSGERTNSGYGETRSDGTFTIFVSDGVFTLNIYVPGEGCTFVGRYGPDGFTTVRELATRLKVDGAGIVGIEIVLPADPDALPFIEWCA